MFVYAGIILLFIGNMFFSQRIVRAQHPHFGWSKPFSAMLPVFLVIIIGSILALIVVAILQFYTLNVSTLSACRNVQRYGETLYMIVAFLPLPILTVSSIIRWKLRKTKSMDKFGAGSMRAKIAIVMISAFFLTLGATFRAATQLTPPVPLVIPPTSPQGHPTPAPQPWWLSKACFYIFNFTIEISIVIFWLIARIDKRFIVPDGAKGPFSYGGGFTFAGENGHEKRNVGGGSRDSLHRLTESRTTLRSSRTSWGPPRSGADTESRISWGGISREEISQGLGEDGIAMPYAIFGNDLERTTTQAADAAVEGAEKEMGWDPKSGKWALRPVHTTHSIAPSAYMDGRMSRISTRYSGAPSSLA